MEIVRALLAKIVIMITLVVIAQNSLYADGVCSDGTCSPAPRVQDGMNNESNKDKTAEEDASSDHEDDTKEEKASEEKHEKEKAYEY